MLRSIVSVLFVAFTANVISGQVLQPVSWAFSANHVEGDTYELIFKAMIKDEWAIYSQHVGDNGPIPTSFTFDTGEHFTVIGEVRESENGKTSIDPIFEMELTKFRQWAEFIQTVEVADKRLPITGYLTFMCCDEERCLPPRDVAFTFVIDR